MNQLLDTDNQQKHKKDSDENSLFPKGRKRLLHLPKQQTNTVRQRYAHEKFDSFYPVFAAKVGIFTN